MSTRMNRAVLVIVAVVAGAAIVLGALYFKGVLGGDTEAAASLRYRCPMPEHPTIYSKPGACPICGMDLKLVKPVMASGTLVAGRTSISLMPDQLQLIGVKTGPVEKRAVTGTIRAAGRIEYNERRLRTVALKVGGWIERLDVSAAGDPVHRGDALFELYSPDLYEAQRSFVSALEARAALGDKSSPEAAADQNVKAARDRLLLWDLAPEQVADLEKKREPQKTVAILSKESGVVIKRNAVQGAYVQPGTELYEIANLASVWVHADVYEQELPGLAPGAKARIELVSQPGKSLRGEVVYLYPYMNAQTRTTTVRIEAQNNEGLLKPGMYATVSIEVPLGENVVVDDSAVMDTGERQIVFVKEKEEGRFSPREVKTGARADGQVIVLEGLTAGEVVVTSGNFLIDAESRMKAAQAAAAGGGGQPQEQPAAPTGHEQHQR
jgi:membrane fusion protein, copper/silver efflux system